jgi:hypothetical protein
VRPTDPLEGIHKPTDWAAWHADYDQDTPLRRRLEIVQRYIAAVVSESKRSPIKVISMCAGEARDLLGALEMVVRRDVRGRLVELNPVLAATARRRCEAMGLSDIEVVSGDAGNTSAYVGAEPADLVLACGVFGNISDGDVERTVRALPSLCARRGTVIWTRHRRTPDLTPAIRRWFTEAGFEETAFEPVPDSPGSVGVAKHVGNPVALRDQQLFRFTASRS